MSNQDKIPFLDLDSSPKKIPLKSVKSMIQRAPEAEDGEIVSSPETDHADIEIKIHAEMTSSDESDEVEETIEITETPEKTEETSNVKENTPEVIQILDTPEKESRTSPEDFPQKSQPAPKKRIVVKHDADDEVEIDHLEITAPLQKEVKKTKSRVVRDSDKSHSPKDKFSSPEKDKGSVRSRSPREDSSRKRGYDVFDERKSRSDTETENRNRKLEKQNTSEIEDLRRHLLKKTVSSDRLRTSDKELLNRKRDFQERSKDAHRSKDQEKLRNTSKDMKEKERETSGREQQSIEPKNSRHRDALLNKTHDEIPLVKKDRKEKESTKSENSRKDKKDKAKKSDEKSKKKKKKKDKRKEDTREKNLSLAKASLTKSGVDEAKRMELDYDDISSEASSCSPLLKKNNSLPNSPRKSPIPSPTPIQLHSPSKSSESSSRSLSRSPIRSPSRSPTPVRSPTPQRKRSYYPAIEGCRNVEEFTWLNRIEEGTYGVVYRAKDKRSDEIVALKRLKMEKEREGFPITSLREINTLLKAQHPNIVTVREIVVGSNMDKIYIVMDYVEHDLKGLMETMTQPFLVGEVKTLMLQLLRGVRHMHDNWILHRDIKASNLLLSHQGILKIGDFGLAREYGSPLKRYTTIVVTLWYRAPELLLGAKEYSTPIDLWSVGCVFAELLTMKPLFPGRSEIDQINKIFKELGTPNDRIWPGPPAYSDHPQVKKMNIADHRYNVLRQRFGTTLTDKGFDLMNKLLTYDPAKRISAEEAIKHEYFKESPTPVDPSMFPTWPAKSELGHKALKKKNASPKAPEGGNEFNLQGDDGGFHMPTTHKGSAAKGLGFNLKF